MSAYEGSKQKKKIVFKYNNKLSCVSDKFKRQFVSCQIKKQELNGISKLKLLHFALEIKEKIVYVVNLKLNKKSGWNSTTYLRFFYVQVLKHSRHFV